MPRRLDQIELLPRRFALRHGRRRRDRCRDNVRGRVLGGRQPQRLDRLADVLRDVERAGAVRRRQDERKLVAVVARDQIARTPDDPGERAANLLEHIVAGLAPEFAVVGAEMIDVDEDERQGLAVAARTPPLAFEKLEELLVVGDRGQRIFRAEPLQLDARRFKFSGAELERLLDLRGARGEPLTADIGPHAKRRQSADQCRNDRQPILHSSLHWCQRCSMKGHSTPALGRPRV